MLLEKVKNTLVSNRMLEPGDRVLVAVSGGPDSVALCHLLHRLRKEHNIDLLLAHVNHGLRGVEANKDASFVESLGNQFGLPVVHRRLNVSSWQKKHGGSLQMAARSLRHQSLQQVMAEEGASKLALGHNADDQAEEVLLRLFRGAGQRGLTGMPACSRDGIIRPLLECHRHEIMAYLHSHGLDFRQDDSNLRPWCQRNLLRLEILPHLRRDFNSNLNATLVRTTKILREEQDYWDAILQAWLQLHVRENEPGGIRLPIAPLLETHPAMQRRLLRRVAEEVKGDLRGFTFQHTEILMQFCRSHTSSGQIHLPGALIVEKNYGWLTVSVTQEDPVDFFYEIPGPGVHPLHLLDHSMEVQFLDLEGPPQFSDDPTDAFMDRDRISFPLFLRSIKSGDRFRPLGLDGSKKLKDFFIDLKVPRSHRRRIPVLCSKDHIVWLVGFRLDDRVKITTNTSRVARFRFRKGIEGE